MDTCRNIFPITFEPVRKLLITAYKSGDFTAADVIIARNTVKQTAMVWKLMNGSMDAYCWSSGRAVAYMLSRTSHPGYMLQLTSFVRGHATGDTNIKHAGELRLPDGACAVGVEHADLGIEGELAERYASISRPMRMSGSFDAAMRPRVANLFNFACKIRTAKYRTASVRRLHGNQPQYLPHRFRAR